MMEWVLTLMSSFVVLFLLAPFGVLIGGLILLGLANHLLSASAASRSSFDCPFAKQRATVEFLTAPGADEPSDVLSCSVFAPKAYHVRCEKGCLGLAKTGWAASPMMPRFSLLSGGVAYRAVTPAEREPASPPDSTGQRAA
jgi:hypothetical protein